MKNQKGFTLTQTIISVAIVGVMVSLAVPGYHMYMANAQAAEISTMINASQVNAALDLKKGVCPNFTATGRYGVLVGSGSFNMSKGGSCSTGCELTYTFNANGVSKDLNGKVAAVSLLNNGKIAENTEKTTVPKQYLSGLVLSQSNLSGEDCSVSNATPPTTTEGSNLGTETGDTDPTPVTPPATGGSGGGTTTTPPTTGGTGGAGSGGTTPLPVDPANPTDPNGSGGTESVEEPFLYHGSIVVQPGVPGVTSYQAHSTRRIKFPNGTEIKNVAIFQFGATINLQYNKDIGNPPKSLTLRLKNGRGNDEVMYFKNLYSGGFKDVWVYSHTVPKPNGISSTTHSWNVKAKLSPEVFVYFVDYQP